MDKYEFNLGHNRDILERYNLNSLKEFPEEVIPALAGLITWQSKDNGYRENKTLIQLVNSSPEQDTTRLKNLKDYMLSKISLTREHRGGEFSELASRFPTLYQLDRESHTIRIQGLTPMQWLQLLEYTASNLKALESYERDLKAQDAGVNNGYSYTGYSSSDIDSQFSGWNVSFGKEINNVGLADWETEPLDK